MDQRARLLFVLCVLVAACAGERSALEPPAARHYPDAIERSLRRMASEPRPVEDSAMPPRHLDEVGFPEALVRRDRIVSGGVLPDQIPAIDEPAFAPAETVEWLAAEEAVLVLQVDAIVRAYPVQIMTWHEIVNDTVGGRPIAVTFCPLCNSGVAFDRRVGGRTLDFGTSGALYQSALVMYDRQTESLWTHFDGRAVVGTMVGAELDVLPVATVAWQDFRAAHPEAPVLNRDTGHDRPYGRNRYVAYDSLDRPLTGWFSGDVDARLEPMARVVGIHLGNGSTAVPLDVLRERGVVEARLDGRRITVWHRPGLASALDAANVAGGDEVGAVGVFEPQTEQGPARFTRTEAGFVDDRTGSRWNILGEAVAGPAAGQRLVPVTHVDTFWFAWSTYRPATTVVP